MTKAALPLPVMFVLAGLAGAFISMGGILSTVVMSGSKALPFGVARWCAWPSG